MAFLADLEESNHVLRGAREPLPQIFPLSCDPDGAVVGVADARHDAPLGDQRNRSKTSERGGEAKGRNRTEPNQGGGDKGGGGYRPQWSRKN